MSATPTSPQIPFNFIPLEGNLADALNLVRKEVMMNLNCHHIGTIQSFNSTLQTATVTINYPKTYFELNAKSGLYTPVLVNYPILVDCPVISLGGGGGALTFPIAPKDECLVLFNDRDLYNWFQGGTGAAVATPRLHSFSDAIILVGLRSQGKVLTNYDPTRVVLRNGTALVGVNTGQVRIANSANGSLGVAMTSLLTALTSFLTSVSTATSVAQIASAASTMESAIVTAVANIEGILE